MKTTKEKADELVKKYLQLDILVSESEEYLIMRNSDAVQCAALSVKHTISILQLALDNQAMYNDDYNVLEQLEYQQLLLTELESRL